jgi:hypothetical protein
MLRTPMNAENGSDIINTTLLKKFFSLTSTQTTEYHLVKLILMFYFILC